MPRRNNPSNTLIYLFVGLGTFFVTRAFIGAATPTPTPKPIVPQITTAPPSSQPPRYVPSSPPSSPLVLDWPNERVMVIGDSLGSGVQPLLQSALRARNVEAFLPISVKGTNTLQWCSTRYDAGRLLEESLASFRPTLVLISLGTNDEGVRDTTDWRGNPWPSDSPYGPDYDVAKQRKPHIEKLAEKLASVKSVWLGPPTPDPLFKLDRGFRNLIAQTWDGRYFDSEQYALGKQSDGIHLSTRGNNLWASKIMEFLDSFTE